MIKIYHNPRCRKSRSGLEYLKTKGLEFKVVEYMKEHFTVESFKEILAKLNISPKEMIREQEQILQGVETAVELNRQRETASQSQLQAETCSAQRGMLEAQLLEKRQQQADQRAELFQHVATLHKER